MTQSKNKLSFGEGAIAIARVVAACHPGAVAAYPITPQTHIVEELARLKAEGADYEYVRAESEAAAAAIVLGAASAGERAYTATSSQGLLFMLETLYNAAGLNIPFVLTLANRSLSAPINIWNDHSDAMAMRDAGIVMLFAENVNEAIKMHISAFRLAAEISLPVAVNVDGFLLTHASESYREYSSTDIGGFIPDIAPRLDVNLPETIGHLYGPEIFQQEKQTAHYKLCSALKNIFDCEDAFNNHFATGDNQTAENNGWLEYYGPAKADTVIIMMGSTAGTAKDAIDEANRVEKRYALLRLKTFRPLPSEAIFKLLKDKKYIAAIDRSLSLGSYSPLRSEISTVLGRKVAGIVAGLGGRPITRETIFKALDLTHSKADETHFI